MPEPSESAGVQGLIERLKAEGVSAGEAQARGLITEAQREADQIVARARQEADAILEEAHHEADKTRKAGEDAVRQAVRDAVLTLREEVAERFRSHLKRLIGGALSDPEFLRRMLTVVVQKSLPEEEKRLEVLLPGLGADADQIRRDPEEWRQTELGQFVSSLAADTLREGLSLGTSDGGLRVRVIDDDVEIDLGEEAITDLLQTYLLPRFRALMEGIGT
jgi:V/A-type H+-transporting ATPase subunit E